MILILLLKFLMLLEEKLELLDATLIIFHARRVIGLLVMISALE